MGGLLSCNFYFIIHMAYYCMDAIRLSGNVWINIPVGPKTCRCAEHIASRMDLLDGARLEIRLASTQDQSTLRIHPEGMQVNLTCN